VLPDGGNCQAALLFKELKVLALERAVVNWIGPHLGNQNAASAEVLLEKEQGCVEASSPSLVRRPRLCARETADRRAVYISRFEPPSVEPATESRDVTKTLSAGSACVATLA
jgi:hypothetical protein